MIVFPAYAANFELHPVDGSAARHLAPLIAKLNRVDFSFSVENPNVNQGQMQADFDDRLEEAFMSCGACESKMKLTTDVPHELDFSFIYEERTVAVEIEKANREKILRDLLKSHMYLHAGADYAVIALPRNYAHSHGIWNLFQFGRERYNECVRYGFGHPDNLGRIALLGYDQYEATGNRLMTAAVRKEMRKEAVEKYGELH